MNPFAGNTKNAQIVTFCAFYHEISFFAGTTNHYSVMTWNSNNNRNMQLQLRCVSLRILQVSDSCCHKYSTVPENCQGGCTYIFTQNLHVFFMLYYIAAPLLPIDDVIGCIPIKFFLAFRRCLWYTKAVQTMCTAFFRGNIVEKRRKWQILQKQTRFDC